MASIIDDKIYNLISKSENFDFAHDIYERFDSIKERIIQEFWNNLILKLAAELRDIKFTERNDQPFHFDLSIKSINGIKLFVGIYDNQFQYGISITHKGSKKNIQELEEYFQDAFDQYEYDDKIKTSWFFEVGEEDFNTLSGLKKILPENRDVLIQKYLNDFNKMFDLKHKLFIEFETNILLK